MQVSLPVLDIALWLYFRAKSAVFLCFSRILSILGSKNIDEMRLNKIQT